MLGDTQESPFADLPSALVEEILELTEGVGQLLLDSFNEMRDQRATRRAELEVNGLLKRESDLGYVPIPTTCGIDGSYAVERMLGTDLVAAAALAVEGLTPPSEARHWPEPRHQVILETEFHNADTGTVVRAIMMGMELELAIQAPHDVVFLDGSFTTPLIYLNQALNKVIEVKHLKVANHLQERIVTWLRAYQSVLASHRTDHYWVAVPKYTTRREIGEYLGWSAVQDDRGMLSNILFPGEYTKPRRLQSPDQPWHLNLSPVSQEDRSETESLKSAIIHLLNEIYVVYYRPFPWLPALRLEMSRGVAQTPGQLAVVIHAVKHQCGAAAMMEPYPLYMADRMVKHLSRAVPTFRQVTSQQIAETYKGNIDDVFLNLHSYRTESGR
jgi:hypothetical protein